MKMNNYKDLRDKPLRSCSKRECLEKFNWAMIDIENELAHIQEIYSRLYTLISRDELRNEIDENSRKIREYIKDKTEEPLSELPDVEEISEDLDIPKGRVKMLLFKYKGNEDGR